MEQIITIFSIMIDNIVVTSAVGIVIVIALMHDSKSEIRDSIGGVIAWFIIGLIMFKLFTS